VQHGLTVGAFLCGSSADDGHAERVGDEFGAHVVGDGPADDHSGIGVEYRGAVDFPFFGVVFGDVGYP
jgi:hypothetical protein